MTFSEFIKDLTKKEKKHLREANVTTVPGLVKTFKFQKKCRKDNPDGIEPCWQCKSIARKLDFDV